MLTGAFVAVWEARWRSCDLALPLARIAGFNGTWLVLFNGRVICDVFGVH